MRPTPAMGLLVPHSFIRNGIKNLSESPPGFTGWEFQDQSATSSPGDLNIILIFQFNKVSGIIRLVADYYDFMYENTNLAFLWLETAKDSKRTPQVLEEGYYEAFRYILDALQVKLGFMAYNQEAFGTDVLFKINKRQILFKAQLFANFLVIEPLVFQTGDPNAFVYFHDVTEEGRHILATPFYFHQKDQNAEHALRFNRSPGDTLKERDSMDVQNEQYHAQMMMFLGKEVLPITE
ncbi:hypothetical protein [Deinococcus cellulosilyticus]|uniref:Uncharacterized protein n=1 Tax=Deinococcus cellulosilyticus (strain DSM 18568 / NBRC 106333 / KACC 11606 / 5516J-15) TaxID=1223518 RepID=A0A511MY78_DEIC1|nr:hypothetical protein [Deinococcus cellulosilyticus]GEM45519.1 hypothetical protein DC3_11540 [Deinococcus cellulosilyticus NBRC 106333 = KACC 11606]